MRAMVALAESERAAIYFGDARPSASATAVALTVL